MTILFNLFLIFIFADYIPPEVTEDIEEEIKNKVGILNNKVDSINRYTFS
jgi:hypothetical protein